MSKDIEEQEQAEKLNISSPAVVEDIVIDSIDFQELVELEKATRATEDQLNRLTGTIYRLSKDQEVYYNHEKTLNGQIEAKRKELIKRYKLDEKRKWQIDLQTKKVVYSQ